MKLCTADNRTIDFIQFKNIKIALDRDTYIFISSVDKNNNIKVHRHIKEKLSKKFKAHAWDFISYNENMLHIKFLVKYSPILSKFVDLTEFDTIEFTPSSDDVVDNWCNISYVSLNDGEEFLNSCNISYTLKNSFPSLNSIYEVLFQLSTTLSLDGTNSIVSSSEVSINLDNIGEYLTKNLI